MLNNHEAKILQTALLDLLQNQSYQIVKKELEDLKRREEDLIFDENKYNGQYDGERKYTQVDLLIIKRNIIDKFINIPIDLIQTLESYK